MCEVRAYVALRCHCQDFAPRVKPERTPGKPPISGRLAPGIAAGPSRSPLPKAPPAAPLVLSPSITPAGLTRVARERKATQRMLVRQAGCPNRSPGGDRATHVGCRTSAPAKSVAPRRGWCDDHDDGQTLVAQMEMGHQCSRCDGTTMKPF